MHTSGLFAELEAAIKSGTAEKRVDTLRRITDLFLGEAERLSETQVSVFDDVILHLVKRIESKALIQLSKSLAPVDNAPIEVIRRLARDDDVTIAGPVLSQSNRLADEDLVSIAKIRDQGHLLAIANRGSLSESVTDVLVDRGDVQVRHTLARNADARFSEYSFSNLVMKSENDATLAEKLGLRLDIPLNLLRQLLARASDLVRSRLLASASPENQEKIERALASIMNEVRPETTGVRDFEEADDIVLQLNRRGKLNETVFLDFVRDRKYEEMVATLALFCAAKSDLIEKLLKNVSYEGVVIACKAAKLHWPTVSFVLQNRFAQHSPSEQEIQQAKNSFFELSQDAAQRSIRFMQVQRTAKTAP